VKLRTRLTNTSTTGISIHVGQAILSHLFSRDMSWGATSKEVDDVSFVDEIPRVLKNFKVCLLDPHFHIPSFLSPLLSRPITATNNS